MSKSLCDDEEIYGGDPSAWGDGELAQTLRLRFKLLHNALKEAKKRKMHVEAYSLETTEGKNELRSVELGMLGGVSKFSLEVSRRVEF